MDTTPKNTVNEVTNKPPVTDTSNHTKYWILGIVLLLFFVIAGVGLLRNNSYPNQMTPTQNNYTNSSTSNTAIPTATVSPNTGTETASNAGGVNKTDTSNAQLDQDLQTIQGNLNQLNTDQGTANQSVQNQSSDVPQQ